MYTEIKNNKLSKIRRLLQIQLNKYKMKAFDFGKNEIHCWLAHEQARIVEWTKNTRKVKFTCMKILLSK
jgi:hypothetical protein